MGAGPHVWAYVAIHAKENPYSVPPRCLCNSLSCGAYGAFCYGIYHEMQVQVPSGTTLAIAWAPGRKPGFSTGSSYQKSPTALGQISKGHLCIFRGQLDLGVWVLPCGRSQRWERAQLTAKLLTCHSRKSCTVLCCGVLASTRSPVIRMAFGWIAARMTPKETRSCSIAWPLYALIWTSESCTHQPMLLLPGSATTWAADRRALRQRLHHKMCLLEKYQAEFGLP